MVTASAEQASESAGKPTILVVEDEVLLRMMIAQELESQGFHVIQAADADEALSVLHTSTPVEVLMTDIRMPGSIDGLELAGLTRATWPELKIVVVSAHLTERPSRQIVDAFFGKPCDMARLVQRISELLPRSRA